LSEPHQIRTEGPTDENDPAGRFHLVLKPFQVSGVNFLKLAGRALLADDPGLGKSAQALRAAKGKGLLIVSPAMLAGTWMDEIEKWAPERISEWKDGKPFRLGDETAWVSYSSLWQRGGGSKVLPRPEFSGVYDTVIFDEAHNLKSRNAKQTIASLQVSQNAGETYLLTGTPIPNWAHELFPLLRMIHKPGDTRYTSYWRWVNTWFRTWKPQWGGTAIGGLRFGLEWHDFYEGNDLDTLMLKRTRKQVLKDLPPLTEVVVEVPMEPSQRKVYDQLKKDYFAFIEETGEEVMAFSDGGLHVKLEKAMTGLPSLDPEANILSSCKLNAMMELVEEREGSPVVVFCHFRNTAMAIQKAVHDLLRKKCGVVMGGIKQSERDGTMNSFKNGGLDVLVGTLSTLGEGVTLTRSSTCIFVERSWVPSKNEQAMRRLHRIGQTQPVSVIYIITSNSLDQHKSKVLANKTDEQVKALSAREFAKML